MSSKYDKRIEMSREEEGSYHRREIEHTTPPTTKNYTTYSTQVVPVSKSRHTSDDDDDDNFEEWTTSKRKVNHKTRQVETRVSRQLLVEDGKVIADSGPQVTTRIKEDNRVEECEKEKAPKNKSKFEAIENAPEAGEAHGRVLGEKKEVQRTSREVREENMQYHDERFKELTGHDVHRRALKAPHELITINDHKGSVDSKPRGKMVHYSNKGKKYRDTDEILEVAKLAIDGSITKEVKRTKHHEECSEDEKPDETGEAEVLRHAPIVQRSSRQHADIVHDFNDTSTPVCSSDDEQEASHYQRNTQRHRHETKSPHSKHRESRYKDNEAFPRYEIDPLLNSLKDEDFKPACDNTTARHHSSDRYREHALLRKDQSSDDEQLHSTRHQHHQQRPASRQRSPSPYQAAPVEIPEEYRTNRHRLLTTKNKSSSGERRQDRERSFSPTGKSHLSHASHRSVKSHKEDASVQAHLTDEEEERKSLAGSSGSSRHTHEKTTKHLQRQSTANSSRNYYFGDSKRRPASIQSSGSSSSLSDPKERARKSGARSRDSGFKSPHSVRTPTPISTTSGQQQIYSVSSKSKKNRADQERAGAVSPTPTSGSVGQRSVKTTTTTLAAGLTDRPRSRQSELARTLVADYDNDNQRRPRRTASSKEVTSMGAKRDERASKHDDQSSRRKKSDRVVSRLIEPDDERSSFDSVSLSSLGPNATTIKVPYQQVMEHETKTAILNKSQLKEDHKINLKVQMKDGKRKNASDMQLHENIENLRKRLDNINKDNQNNLTITRKRADDDGHIEEAAHFDYKTIVATVQPKLHQSRQQVVDTYNVRVIEHSSPFREHQTSNNVVNEPSSCINRLESLSSELSTRIVLGGQQERTPNTREEYNTTNQKRDNNNEANFNIADYLKYDIEPADRQNLKSEDMTYQTTRIEAMNDNGDDAISSISSCSLRSTRTYDVRVNDEPIANDLQQIVDDELNDEKHFPVETVDFHGDQESESRKRAAAWIFDPEDGSTTAIVAPIQPKKLEPPIIEPKTEELAESRGGRSYYLELIEADRRKAKQQRPSSIDSLYSRWNSHSTLSNTNSSSNNNNHSDRSSRHLTTPINNTPTFASSTNIMRKSRQRLPASVLDLSNCRQPVTSSTGNNANRSALPFGGPPLSSRSKSSSCLASSTRPTKYSIYGGLKRTNDVNKPVPRLSYSRAIGPKSQRQIDAQFKTPSRYLKLK